MTDTPNDEYIKQNGAEYKNRTIIKTARSMVHQKNLY